MYCNLLYTSNVLFFKAAIKRGAVSVREPWEETDEDGTVTFATVQTVSNSAATYHLL